MECEIPIARGSSFRKGVRKSLLKRFCRLFLLILCHVFFYLSLFTTNWMALLLAFGGKRVRDERGFIGVRGLICTSQKEVDAWVFENFPVLMLPF